MAGSNVVRATLIADDRQFKSGFKSAEDTTKSFEKKISGTAGMVKGVLAGAAAAAVVAFAKDSIRAFSELEQSTGSVESVFGSAADKIVATGKMAATQFGLSANEFNESAALIGSQLKNTLGLSADEASVKVEELVGRASDMAAVFGGSTADAVAAIGSLMRGERDPIEKYGVSMNDAAIQAKAMEMGLADVNGELTPAAKGTAALEILFDQTADSAGQFADEADTLAGKQQRLNAQAENAKAIFGQGLAPAFGLATDAAGGLWDIVGDVGAALGELTGQFTAADQVLRNAAENWDATTTASERFTDVVGESIVQMGHWDQSGQDFQEELLKSTDALNLTTEELMAMKDQLPAIARNLDLTAEAEASWTDVVKKAIIQQKQEEDQLAENKLRMEALTGATEDTTDATESYMDTLRAQVDPVFAAARAAQNLKTEQQKLKDMQADSKTTAGQLADQQLRVVDATLDLQGAVGSFSGDNLSTAIDTIATALRISKDEAKQLLVQLGLIDGKTVNAYVNVYNRQRGHPGTGGVQEYHEGGIVPGPPGTEVPIMAMAGETILPTHRGGGSSPLSRVAGGPAGPGGNVIINITVNALDPQGAAKAVMQAIESYRRNNGGFPTWWQ